MLISFYVACCLYKQFIATEKFIIRLHTPKLLNCQGLCGTPLDLNATNKGDFYWAQRAEPPC